MRGVLAAIGWGCLLQAQSFDVASVKRHPVGEPYRGGFKREITPTRLALHNASLGNCIWTAFGYQHWEVAGPAWRDYPTDAVYEIDARSGAPATEKQMLAMLQTLLKERLGLAFHREKRDVPVYALVVAKGGPKFQKSESEGAPKMTPGEHLSTRFERISMARLVEILDPPFTSRHTIDETGLAGVYDLNLDLGPYVVDSDGKAILDGRGAIDMESAYIQALPAQLGLRLEKKTAPMDVMVIDRVEKDPTGN